MLATTYGRAEVVKLLLENGADVTLKSAEDETALMFAITYRQNEMAEILKAAGAK